MSIYFSCGQEHGLIGICTDAAVKALGASECTAFSLETTLEVVIASGGVQKKNPKLGEVSLTKGFDNMSPALFSACTLGKTIAKVQIDLAGTAGDAGKSSMVYLTYELKNAVVTSHSISSGGDMPEEVIKLAYEEMSMSYKTPPKTAKNTDGSPVVQKWSVIENKKP